MQTDTLAEVIALQLEQIFGPPDNTHVPAESLMRHQHVGMLASPLASAFTDAGSENRWHGNEAILAALKQVMDERCRANEQTHRRDLLPLCHAWQRLEGSATAAERERWRAGLLEIGTAQLMPDIRACADLRALSSATIDYGSNHLAVELANLCAFIARLDFDARPLAEDMLQRFFDYMHPDGYWVECDGPALMYNTLTAHALYLACRELDLVDRHRDHLRQAAYFHAITTMPDLTLSQPINGRTHHHRGITRMSFLPLHPAGKALHQELATHYHHLSANGQWPIGNIEGTCNLNLSRLGNEEQTQSPAASIWFGDDRSERLEHYAIVRRSGWITCLSAQPFRPRPEGHWNLDYTSLIDCHHEDFGPVLYGCNSKADPLASTFHVRMQRFDDHLLAAHQPMWIHIPDRGSITCTDDWREYRAFEGLIAWHADGRRAARLIMRARARTDRYPIEATLQPPLRYGDRFTDGNGREHLIGDRPFELSAEQLGGHLLIDARDSHTWRLQISLPEQAVLRWSHPMWDPYDQIWHYYQDIGKHATLLHAPVGPAEAEFGFALLERS